MRFDREPWVKLYRHEGSQHRLMSLEARSFRDFLLRHANDDGVLIPRTKNVAKDLCKVVAADSKDARKVRAWVKELSEVGYLTVSEDGQVLISKFVEGQTARSKNAERQAKFKAKRRKQEAERQASDGVTGNVSDNGSEGYQDNAQVTLQREEKRREGEEIPPTPQGGDNSNLQIPCPSPTLTPELASNLAEHYGVPLDAVRAAAKRFSDYYVVGRGADRRHSRGVWISQCREWIRKDHESGKLTNSAPQPAQTAVSP